MQIWSAEIKELESLCTSIKGRFPELEKELEQLIKFDDANVILIYSRRCLEVIISDLCIKELKRPRKTEPLKGIIDKLSHEDKVPSHIIASMEGLNSLSTFGAHPKDFDPEQVKPVLSNLNIIIKWYLKYKDTQIIGMVKPEEKKYENKEPGDIKEGTQKSKKKLILILSGILLLVVIIVVSLFVFNIIVGRKQTKEIEKSIAVLPFKLLSDEPDKQYLADGMVDAITLHLSKIKGLRVMSRTSGEQYRGTTKTTRTIGKELDVEYLLEGSFQKFGDDVKLIVQLINAREESHEWANEYDSKWNDIFSLQSEIAQKIAKEMSIVISPEEKEYINKAPTTDLRAYDFYLRGINELWRLGQQSVDRESIEKAEILFNQALQYDPSFALAYVGLGHVYWKKSYLPENDLVSLMDSVLVLANIALSYDDKLAEAYYLRGAYFYFEKGDLKKTEEEWDKAIKVNPNQWHVYAGKRWLPSTDLITQIENQIKAASLNHDIGFSDLLSDIGWSFFEAGFPEKASFYYNEVLKLDGDSVRYLYSLAEGEQYIAGNYNKSLELLGKICTIDSTFSKLDRLFALNYLYTGQFEKSLLHLTRLKSAGRIHEIVEYRIAYIYWINGYKKEAESYFDKAMETNLKRIVNRSDDPDSHYSIACIYAVRGDREKAIEHLKLFNQYESKGYLSWVTFLKNDPLLNNIRNEPEFQQIVIDVESRHRAVHEKVRKWLEEQGML